MFFSGLLFFFSYLLKDPFLPPSELISALHICGSISGVSVLFHWWICAPSPVPCFLHIWWGKFLSLHIFKGALVLWPHSLLWKCHNCFIKFHKKSYWNFSWICIESADQFRGNCKMNEVICSYSWIYFSPFTKVFFKFMIFPIEILYIFD